MHTNGSGRRLSQGVTEAGLGKGEAVIVSYLSQRESVLKSPRGSKGGLTRAKPPTDRGWR